jgi:hypothetical protein
MESPLETALLMWEACAIPSLLHGAGTWVEITPATERTLNSLQQWFLRLVLQVGPGAPLASLAWETGTMDMKLRVWRETVLLVLHLRGLAQETLASQIYREQVDTEWPGLAKEASNICQQLNLEDCNKTNMTKQEYKKMLMKALLIKDEETVRNLADGKLKCKKIMEDPYGKKLYIGQKLISEVRLMFRTRTGLLPFAGNYSHDRRFAKTNWMCRCEESKEDEPHLVAGKCTVYNDIRENYGDLTEDNELVKYFSEVMERREIIDKLNEEENEMEGEETRQGGGPTPPLPASWVLPAS